MKRHDKGLACHGHAAMGNMPWTSMTVTRSTMRIWSNILWVKLGQMWVGRPVVCCISSGVASLHNVPDALFHPIVDTCPSSYPTYFPSRRLTRGSPQHRIWLTFFLFSHFHSFDRDIILICFIRSILDCNTNFVLIFFLNFHIITY